MFLSRDGHEDCRGSQNYHRGYKQNCLINRHCFRFQGRESFSDVKHEDHARRAKYGNRPARHMVVEKSVKSSDSKLGARKPNAECREAKGESREPKAESRKARAPKHPTPR